MEQGQRTHGFDLTDTVELTDDMQDVRRVESLYADLAARGELNWPRQIRYRKAPFLSPRDVLHLEDMDEDMDVVSWMVKDFP